MKSFSVCESVGRPQRWRWDGGGAEELATEEGEQGGGGGGGEPPGGPGAGGDGDLQPPVHRGQEGQGLGHTGDIGKQYFLPLEVPDQVYLVFRGI